jgi:mersacidin/lichenicidin family type 2 lantibiotic
MSAQAEHAIHSLAPRVAAAPFLARAARATHSLARPDAVVPTMPLVTLWLAAKTEETMSKLETNLVVNAWRDGEFFEDLSVEQKEALPKNPAGPTKLRLVTAVPMASSTDQSSGGTCDTWAGASGCCSTWAGSGGTCDTWAGSDGCCASSDAACNSLAGC